MKKFCWSVMLVVAAFGLSSVSMAQGPGGPPGGMRGGPGGGMRGGPPGARFKTMEMGILGQLNLNASQKKKVGALTDGAISKMKAMAPKPGQKMDFQAMRPKMKALRDDYEAGLGKVLTPAQMTKYKTLRDAERAKMRAQFGGGRGGPGGGMRGGPGAPGPKPGG